MLVFASYGTRPAPRLPKAKMARAYVPPLPPCRALGGAHVVTVAPGPLPVGIRKGRQPLAGLVAFIAARARANRPGFSLCPGCNVGRANCPGFTVCSNHFMTPTDEG